MALDTGYVPDEFKAHPDWKDPAPSITDAATLGDGLRIARELSGKPLAELARETKVHTRFLTALEQNDWSSLPSRVFAIGYVRSYATALGLDEQLAIERFKRESPDTSVPLKAPVGVAFEEVKRNSPRIIAGIAVVAMAILGWNVFQRVNLMRAPHPSDLAATPESWRLGDVPGQQVRLDAPRAAPPDQTVPALYITPGLEAQLTGANPNDPAAVAAAVTALNPDGPVRKAFNPRGPVYGAPATSSLVVIQAQKPGALVVRSGSDQILFARQMAAGESWRAPTGTSAVIDVSDPTVFDVYLNGEFGGVLPGVVTPLSQLNARAEQMTRQMAAESQARQIAQQRAIQQAADAMSASAQTAAQTPAGGTTPAT